MILEVAVLNIKPGFSMEFETAFSIAQSIISSMPGYLSHEVHCCMENSNRYLLLVRWESVKYHTEGFRQSPQYQEWKALLHHFYTPFPTVEHYEAVNDLCSIAPITDSNIPKP